jgi:hypothetical protein
MPSSTLTDTQLVALAAAARDNAGVITIPEKLKGAASTTFGRKLMTLGLAAERRAALHETPWRRDESGDAYVLAVTAAGLAAIGIEASDELAPGAVAPSVKVQPVEQAAADANARTIAMAAAPRSGTKQAQLIALLSVPSGASIEVLTAALGWLPHTTRAALTGLRQKGYAIEREKVVAEGEASTTRYRIVAVVLGDDVAEGSAGSRSDGTAAATATDEAH